VPEQEGTPVLSFDELPRSIQNAIEWHAHDTGKSIKDAMINIIRMGIDSA
jgi:hypothetical protein